MERVHMRSQKKKENNSQIYEIAISMEASMHTLNFDPKSLK
jgi:hypothetical protein